jgi:hypothetical protein
MKSAIKTMMLGVAACAFAAPAFAYTISGTIPGGKVAYTAVNLQKPIPRKSWVKLTISIPQKLYHGDVYSVTFCVGQKISSCTGGYAFSVIPGGQQNVVFYDVRVFSSLGYPIWLGTGLADPVPYVIDVEFLP